MWWFMVDLSFPNATHSAPVHIRVTLHYDAIMQLIISWNRLLQPLTEPEWPSNNYYRLRKYALVNNSEKLLN